MKNIFEILEIHCKMNNIDYKTFIIDALKEKLLKEYNITEEFANKLDDMIKK